MKSSIMLNVNITYIFYITRFKRGFKLTNIMIIVYKRKLFGSETFIARPCHKEQNIGPTEHENIKLMRVYSAEPYLLV